MPTFQNTKKSPLNSKPGDYIHRVVGVTKAFSTWEDTRGCTVWEFRLLNETTLAKLFERIVFCDEQVSANNPEIAEREQAKADMFLRACGVELKVGEAWDFDEEDARKINGRFIEPMGLRGWATIGRRRKKNDKGIWEETDFDEVKLWLEKEKLPRHVDPKPAGDPKWE